MAKKKPEAATATVADTRPSAGWKECPNCKKWIKGVRTKTCPNCQHEFKTAEPRTKATAKKGGDPLGQAVAFVKAVGGLKNAASLLKTLQDAKGLPD